MPELPEVESYRQLAEARALERPIAAVHANDGWYLKRGLTPRAATAVLVGRQLVTARRRGKLLLLDTSDGTRSGPVLGIRFGMSGRLLVDGSASIESLLYSSMKPELHYDRFGLVFADGGDLRIRDPRRLGGVELDPPEVRLGPDALGLTAAQLQKALVAGGGQVALKARLLDQAHLAGVGNLIADEVLWRAGLSPLRPVSSLTPAEVRRLHRHLRVGLDELIERGGSHTGDLMPARQRGGRCPKDGAVLTRSTVGGRTTWWCPQHQR